MFHFLGTKFSLLLFFPKKTVRKLIANQAELRTEWRMTWRATTQPRLLILCKLHTRENLKKALHKPELTHSPKSCTVLGQEKQTGGNFGNLSQCQHEPSRFQIQPKMKHYGYTEPHFTSHTDPQHLEQSWHNFRRSKMIWEKVSGSDNDNAQNRLAWTSAKFAAWRVNLFWRGSEVLSLWVRWEFKFSNLIYHLG